VMKNSHATGWAPDSPTPAQLKELFAQIASGRITKGSLQDFLSGIFDATYPVTIDYSQSIERMIEDGRYDSISTSITSDNFPLKGSGKVKHDLLLVQFDPLLFEDAHVGEQSDYILELLDKRGLKPAMIEDLLAFGTEYGSFHKEFDIVCLGSVWHKKESNCYVPVLNKVVTRSVIYLEQMYGRGVWNPECRFLVYDK
jgi:hypothetical protein